MLEYNKVGRIKYKRNQTTEERFWDKVHKTETCWLWLGKPDKSGYGCLVVQGVHHKAHRLSYEMHKGAIPERMLVRHTCDNPICVNPDHLVVGTYADNAQDREQRGRNGAPTGSNSHFATLTEDTVLVIRWLKKLGMSLDKIATLYHISKSCVWGIVHRRSWKHLPEERVDTGHQEYEVLVKILKVKEEYYNLVVEANTKLEAQTLATSMSATAIRNNGMHLKGADTTKYAFEVIDIVDPNKDKEQPQ